MTHVHESRADAFVASGLVAESAVFLRVLEQICRLARSGTAPILFEGESGTGKTILAHYLHEVSPRSTYPLHSVVLSTLDDSLASSDLFGHVMGAFTDARRPRVGHFIASKGSTLFLDEIGKASRSLQGKLLHAIEYNEVTPVGSDTSVRVDVRIVAATNIPLVTLVERGEFLPDLAARFGYFRIVVPPLRERKRDIPGLVTQGLARHAVEFGYTAIPDVSAELMAVLQSAAWPTNLRGLDSAIQYLLANANGAAELRPHHCVGALEDIVTDAHLHQSDQSVMQTNIQARNLVVELGSISAAARALGVPRSTIQRRLKKSTTDGQMPLARTEPDCGNKPGNDAAELSDTV